jgi:hypothetical protein
MYYVLCIMNVRKIMHACACVCVCICTCSDLSPLEFEDIMEVLSVQYSGGGGPGAIFETGYFRVHHTCISVCMYVCMSIEF